MNKLIINADQAGTTISRHIYGHFAEHLGRCIYEGFWVGEDSDIPNTRGIRNDVVEALRALDIPNLRWPGGCFADEYHWMDGIGPREERPQMINTHWGGVIENNHFGTHEFFDLCELLGTTPYVCGNLGSGTVREMAEWVEYMTHPGGSRMADLRKKNGREEPWKLPFFGVGNENWGCGGNMRPEYYADEYRRYQTFVESFGEEKITKIAGGANEWNYEWTEVLMERAANYMDGLSLHFYAFDWIKRPDQRGSATDFGEERWMSTIQSALQMEVLLYRHGAIMDFHDPAKRVGLMVDEWGTWWDVEPDTNPHFLYQQNTMRDALVAAMTLNIFNAHCDRVRMGNIAQTVNVLQAMILTDGAQMLLTPTYHVFELYKAHQDAQLLPHFLQTDDYQLGDAKVPALNVSASTRDGKVTVTIAHCDPNNAAKIALEVRGLYAENVTGRVLVGDAINAHNTFEAREAVAPRELRADEMRREGERFVVTLPAASVATLSF